MLFKNAEEFLLHVQELYKKQEWKSVFAALMCKNIEEEPLEQEKTGIPLTYFEEAHLFQAAEGLPLPPRMRIFQYFLSAESDPELMERLKTILQLMEKGGQVFGSNLTPSNVASA